MKKKYIQYFLKRFIDIIASLLMIILLSPVLLVISILVRFKLGSPIFFLQERPGYKCNIFKIIKFRTMIDAKDKEGNLLADIERITPFGHFLRSTSIDELPELFNVLIGQMSLVGPRPHLVSYLKLYSDEENRRHTVLPGITGWAQINGRNAISYKEKFKYDLWYIDNWSIFLDFKILLKTVIQVIKRKDINQSNEVTYEPYDGTN